MNNRRIVGVQKNHAFGNLLSNRNACGPRQFLIRFVQQIEESWLCNIKIYAVAIFIDDVEVLLMLSNSYQGHQLRMMSNSYGCHYFSSKLFLWSFRVEVLFNFFNSYFSSSPLALKHFWRVTISYFFLEHKSTEIDYILFSISFHLLHNELLQVDKVGLTCWRISTWFLFNCCLWWFKGGKWIIEWNQIIFWFCGRFLRFLLRDKQYRLLFFTNVNQIVILWLAFYHLWRNNFRGLLFLFLIFVEKEIHKFYFINICFVFRAKDFLRIVAIAGNIWGYIHFRLRLYLTLLFFFKFSLHYTEKIFELIMLFQSTFNWHKIFVQVLMCELHHIATLLINNLFLCIFFKTKILKYFVFPILGFWKSIVDRRWLWYFFSFKLFNLFFLYNLLISTIFGVLLVILR